MHVPEPAYALREDKLRKAESSPPELSLQSEAIAAWAADPAHPAAT